MIQIERLQASDYYADPDLVFVDVFDLHDLYDRLAFKSNLILVGPKGIGKTLSVASWCGKQDIPIITFDCSEDVRRAQLLGTFFLRDQNSSPFVLGPLTTVFELAYYWGLAGTVQALVTPDLGVGFPHPEFFRFFGGHGTIVAGVLVLVVGIGIRPRPWSALRIWAITNALAPPIMLFNWLTKSNYMFLCGPPANSSIYDYFGRWPWSLITLDIVALSMMTLCYLPFWVLNRRARRS